MRKHNGSEQTPVEKILHGADGERWFGDGSPLWTQGRKDRPAKTLRQARLQRRQLVKALRRHGRGDEAALRLADKIAACRPRRRCLSGACPECTRATQRLFVATSDRLDHPLRNHRLIAVSVVFSGAGIADGNLADSCLTYSASFNRGCARRCERPACGKRSAGSMFRQTNMRINASHLTTGRTHGSWCRRLSSREGKRSFADFFPEQDHSPPGICEVLRRGPQGAGLRSQDGFCSADIAPATTSARRQRQPAQHA